MAFGEFYWFLQIQNMGKHIKFFKFNKKFKGPEKFQDLKQMTNIWGWGEWLAWHQWIWLEEAARVSLNLAHNYMLLARPLLAVCSAELEHQKL